MNLQDWADVFTIIAAIGTIAAALVALFAIVQARKLHREKSQPYVVALAESNPHVAEILELAFKNVGATAAHDVVVSFDPVPQCSPWGSATEVEDVQLPEAMPVLVPGQEWRTTWDSAKKRYGAGLPSRHEVTVSYTGLDDERLTNTYVLDWDHMYHRRHLDTKTVHHLAKDVRELRNLFNKAINLRGLKGTLDVRLQSEADDE